MKKIVKYIKKPQKIVRTLGTYGALKWMKEASYLKLLYKAETGKKLNLENPVTFTEKIQWLKLYYRKDIFSKLVDKYEVRSYIADKIGEKHLIPLLGVYDKVDEIPWKDLPDQFVIKCTHGSGCNIICTNKEELNIEEAEMKLNEWMKENWYTFGLEWAYKNVKPRIIVEKYMVDESNYELKDYKMFCFDGEVKMIEVDFNRQTNHTRNLYDTDWNFVDFSIKYANDKNRSVKRPAKLEEMIRLGEILSKGIPHVRVDFYSIEQELYFGELTFYHESGISKFTPEKYDKMFGDWINLKTEI